MAYGLPVYGEDAQTTVDKYNNSIEAVKATAEAAEAKADSAITSIQTTAQTADQALETAEAAKAFVEADTDDRVASLVNDSTSSTGAALDAAYGYALRGNAGRNYRLVAGALRNTGTDWDALDDAGHRPAGVDDVYIYNGIVRVNFTGLGAARVVGFVAGCDETMSKNGFQVGASLGLDYADLTITQTPPEYADYVYYDGTAWVSLNGVFTPTFASGTLALTHTAIPAPLAPNKNYALMSASATVRGGGCIAALESTQSATDTNVIRLRFYDYAGTLLTAPTTDMKVFVRHGGGSPIVRDPASVTTTAYPDSNLWFVAVVEV